MNMPILKLGRQKHDLVIVGVNRKVEVSNVLLFLRSTR